MVILEVSHILISPLKTLALENTAARKEGRVHSHIILWQDKKSSFTHNQLLSPLLNILHHPPFSPLTLTNAFASHSRHQLKPPTEIPNHNSMFTSRQVILKYTFDLLWFILVTCDTSHLEMSLLKAVAPASTVAKKERQRSFTVKNLI